MTGPRRLLRVLVLTGPTSPAPELLLDDVALANALLPPELRTHLVLADGAGCLPDRLPLHELCVVIDPVQPPPAGARVYRSWSSPLTRAPGERRYPSLTGLREALRCELVGAALAAARSPSGRRAEAVGPALVALSDRLERMREGLVRLQTALDELGGGHRAGARLYAMDAPAGAPSEVSELRLGDLQPEFLQSGWQLLCEAEVALARVRVFGAPDQQAAAAAVGRQFRGLYRRFAALALELRAAGDTLVGGPGPRAPAPGVRSALLAAGQGLEHLAQLGSILQGDAPVGAGPPA